MLKKIITLLIFTSLFLPTIFSQLKFAPKQPKLVIQIIVEQMRYDIIQRYWDRFSEKGFKRLINEGAFCKDAQYDYVITESAPGYATIATGSNPSEHGIVSDKWYLRLTESEQYCVADSKLELKSGIMNANRYSPRQLIGSTIGDELRISNYKKSKVISVSINNYASVLTAGYLGNAAYWMDETTGNWTSSSYYLDSLPNWVQKFNQKQFVPLYLSREWNTLYPLSSYTQSLADNNSYETGFSNNQKTFPYNLGLLSTNGGPSILKYTPYGNVYTTDFAVSAIINEDLGNDKYTDLITISYATNGFVTNMFGIRSIELEDTYLRLDKEIAHILEIVDDRFGKENVIVVLTSDRGTIDNPDFYREIGMPSGKFNSEKAISVLESYLKAIYGRSNWVKHYSGRQIYLNQLLIDASKISLADVQLKTAQFMNQFSGIAHTTTATILQTTNFTDGTMKKFQNGYNLVRSGDVMISLKPGWVEERNHKKIEATEQSSPYRYDSHVPLVFYGWKIIPKELLEPVMINDLAPTLGNFLNISYPSGASGKPINGLIVN